MNLCSKNTEISKSSALCLSLIAETVPNHAIFKDIQTIAQCLQFLKNNILPEIQDEIAFAIANICKDEFIQVKLRNLGGIKVILGLLATSGDPDVLKSGLEALYILLNDCEAIQILIHRPKSKRSILREWNSYSE